LARWSFRYPSGTDIQKHAVIDSNSCGDPVDMPYWFTVWPRKCNANGPRHANGDYQCKKITVECRQRAYSTSFAPTIIWSAAEKSNGIRVVYSSTEAYMRYKWLEPQLLEFQVHDSLCGRYHHNLGFTIHLSPVISYIKI
jgi:hypothetical protein